MKAMPWIALFMFAFASAATAQTVTVTAPASGARLKAGDDFATTTFGDQWDMSNPEDISLNPNDTQGFQSGAGISGGLWSGTSSGNSWVMLYSPGLDAPAVAITREGRLFPINTAVYRKMVFKAITNVASRTLGVHWFFGHAGDINNAGVAFIAQHSVAGAAVYSVDLGAVTTGGPGWLSHATARGLRITPSEENMAVNFQLDWVRLTRADSDPLAVRTTISWTSSGSNNVTVDVIDSSSVVVQTVVSGAAASGSATWFQGGLLPGSYTIRIYHSGGAVATRPVVINATPTIQITSPSRSSGADFATVVRGNPWDFSSGADVHSTVGINSISYDGALNGTTDTSGDPQIRLLVDGFGPVQDVSTAIDASKYHYLTFKLKFDLPGTAAAGSWATTRLLFGNVLHNSALLTASQDFTVWLEGLSAPARSYTVDLATLTSGNGLVPGGTGPASWAGTMTHVRFDPSEFPSATTFHLDDLKLTADPVSTNGLFAVTWAATSDQAATVSVALATNINGTGLVTLASGIPATSGSTTIATSSVANGTYFVRTIISDGLDTMTRWSDAPIVIANTAPPPDADHDGLPDSFEVQFGLNPNSNAGNNGANGDPDGDGFTNLQEFQRGSNPVRTQVLRHIMDLNSDRGGDVFLYNTATGARRLELMNRLGPGFTELVGTWDAAWQIYPANLNTDEYTDFFLYDPARGFWIQALNHGGDGTFTYTIGTWDSSWTVVPSDLDGDHLTDMFVYNFNTGVWVKCFVDGAGGFKGYAVGNWDPGWTFYTADLNGDGRDDFFLYNRVNGVWVEAFSQAAFGTFDYPASGQWDPGWQVIRADLNGDGRTDLFLLNAAGVHVSALSLASGGFNYVGGPQWSPGWLVSAGDLNSDGRTDLFLYNSANGIWAEAFSDGAGSFSYAAGNWEPGWTVAITDFNEDGRGDLILSRADGTWIQATNTGVATFTYAVGNWGTGWTLFTNRPSDR